MEGPREIVPGVYGLGSKMVNWYLVVDEARLCAVDAGLRGFEGTLESDLRGLGHRPEDVEAVVLTHSDADHTGLANAFRAAGAEVLVSRADEGTLRKPGPKSGDASPGHLISQLWRPGLWRLFGHLATKGGARPAPVEPTGIFAHGEELDVPGRPRVIATPGHTPGHCALHFERHGALFVGDALCTWHVFKGSSGPQLMPSSLNVSNDEALESLAAIEGVDASVLLPGHGEPWRDGPAAAVQQARRLGRT